MSASSILTQVHSKPALISICTNVNKLVAMIVTKFSKNLNLNTEPWNKEEREQLDHQQDSKESNLLIHKPDALNRQIWNGSSLRIITHSLWIPMPCLHPHINPSKLQPHQYLSVWPILPYIIIENITGCVTLISAQRKSFSMADFTDIFCFYSTNHLFVIFHTKNLNSNTAFSNPDQRYLC